MAIKCPKCHLDNPDTLKFCGECSTQLLPDKEISVTKTLETRVEEFPRGTTFAGRYQIIEKLGIGGMGTVYRVEDKTIGQDVALKLINPEIASDKKTIERFRNELKTARMISHRNVCRMFDLGYAEGKHFITMEYIPGEDLKSFIKRVGQLPSGKTISIAKQVCEGLAEAHNLGVVHRDLKSNNIMIDKEGNARIMDFGIARSHRAKELTGEGIIIGTPEYMSPEQAEIKDIDHRSDIYSLGVIMYEMVTGKLPFEGDTPLSIAMKHKGEIPKSPKELDPQILENLNDLILKCLEKERERRYQSADELFNELDNVEKGVPDTQREIVKRRPTSKKISLTFKLKKLLVVALGIIAIVVLIVLSAYIINKQAFKKSAPSVNQQITFVGNASHPEISPDGKFVAYINRLAFDEQAVMVQDIVSGHTIEVFRIRLCTWLRWTPESSEISFSAELNDGTFGIFIVPRLGGTPRKLNIHGFYFCWSPDGSQIASALPAGKEIRLTNKTTGDSKSIPLNLSSSWLRGIDWSPKDDLLLYITFNQEEMKYTICTITTDGSNEQKVIEDDVWISSPRWSPRGDAIFYIRGEGATRELWKIPVSSETGKPIKSSSVILRDLQAGDYFTITSNGKYLSYTRELNYSNLWLTTVEGSGKEQTIETKQLTTGTLMNSSPSISPDGSQIAFTIGDDKKSNIYIMPIEGGSPTQITYMNSYNKTPVWSPDGGVIAFGSDEGETTKVWKVNAKGGKPHQFIRSKLSFRRDIVWSPGLNILYQRPDNRNFHILNSSTEEETPLVKDAPVGFMFYPQYSSDGKKVAVWWNRKNLGIWVISLLDRSQIFIRKGYIYPLGWSSDNQWIYLYEIKGGTIRIFKIGIENKQEHTVITIPFTFELGSPGDLCMSPGGKHFVIPLIKTNSDVWLVENFDPEMNEKQSRKSNRTFREIPHPLEGR